MASAGLAGIVRRLLGTAAHAQTLLCVGHSHVACVAAAAKSSGVGLHALNFWDMPGAIEQGDGGPVLSEALLGPLRRHAGAVFSLVGGSAHTVLGMVVHPRRFDFVLPEAPGLFLDESAELLPAALVRRLLETQMRDYLAIMDELRRHCRGRLFQLEPPPPHADGARVAQQIPWALYPGMTQEVSPAVFRYKMWRLHSRILMDWCARHDVGFVACPPGACKQDGFLADACYGDGVHASPAYGALVLEQMRQLA